MVGIVVLLITILTTVAAAVAFVFNIFPQILPAGRYPILLLAVPIVGSGLVVGGTLAGICKLLGIALSVPVQNKKQNETSVD